MIRQFRKYSKVFTYTHERVVVTCKDISTLPSDKVISYFGKQESMFKFFDTLPIKARSMQTSDINQICESLSTFNSLNSFAPHLWPDIAEVLCSRYKDLELDEIVTITKIFTQVKTDSNVIKKVFDTMCKELEEIDYVDYKNLSFFKLEELLANYTIKNSGSGLFYQIISEAMLNHKDFEGLAYQHLARLAYYFSRSQKGKQNGVKFMNKVEEILWNAIHQGKLKEMEEITGVISNIIPGNMGSNDLRALLEFTLFRFLANPRNQITISRLLQVVTSFTHYIILYKPLDQLLKQLILDSIEQLNGKELVQAMWAYSRHNKAEPDFINKLLQRSLEIIPDSSLPFRHFTFLMNSVINTGLSTLEISKFINDFSLKCLKTQKIQDHYLVKGLSLIEAGEFLDAGMEEIMSTDRLPTTHPQDLSRIIIQLNENSNLHRTDIINHFNLKVLNSIESMKPSHISRIVYSLARLNQTEPRIFKSLESQILKSDLTKLMPVDLGVACLGFGLTGFQSFCEKALSAINDCFHKYQQREYEDYSDTDDENFSDNKLILVNEQDLDFTKEIPASAVVQMAWMAASLGVDDRMFWTAKLIDKLKSIQLTENTYRLNQWIWTAKTLREEEDFIVGVDRFHYALLMQTLELISKDFKSEFQYNFVGNSKEFIDDIMKNLKKNKIHAEVGEGGIVTDNGLVMLYENSHYVFGSLGYFKQENSADLLNIFKVQQAIMEKKGLKCRQVFKGLWVAATEAERMKIVQRVCEK